MQRIETRVQLIDFICENISRSAIKRACHHSKGSVRVMGGFSRIPPLSKPGWIVVITSVHGRTWIVAVIPDDHRHVFFTRIIESIPWQYYICPSRHDQDTVEYSIYHGDNPDQARLAWIKAKLTMEKNNE